MATTGARVEQRQATIRLELNTKRLPSVRTVSRCLEAVDTAYELYSKSLPHSLVICETEISSFIANLAAVSAGMHAISDLREHLAGFVTSLADTITYVSWFGRPKSARTGMSPPPNGNRELVPVIANLVAAIGEQETLELRVVTDKQTISVLIHPHEYGKYLRGQKEIYHSETFSSIMSTDFIKEWEDALVDEDYSRSKVIALVNRDGRFQGMTFGSIVSHSMGLMPQVLGEVSSIVPVVSLNSSPYVLWTERAIWDQNDRSQDIYFVVDNDAAPVGYFFRDDLLKLYTRT